MNSSLVINFRPLIKLKIFLGKKEVVTKTRKRKLFLMTKINNIIYILIAINVLSYYMRNCLKYKGLRLIFQLFPILFLI